MRFLLLGCLALVAAGCTQSKPPAAPPSFHFDADQTRELLISKADPGTGDHWSARFTRKPGTDWTIALAPEGMHLGDHAANSAFINHVLDTLRTAKSQQAPLSGSLDSFGLTVPRFRLQWDSYDLRIGAPGQTTDPANGDPLIGAYTSTDGKTVWVTTGAALEMLARIQSFETLRQNQLLVLPAGETADDVYEIALSRPREKIPYFYAERLGDGWADSRKKPVDASDFLTKLAHLRILRFVDDGAESSTILKIPPFLKLILKDRAGTPLAIELRVRGNQVFATVSSRTADSGLAVFEVYADLLAWIKQL